MCNSILLEKRMQDSEKYWNLFGCSIANLLWMVVTPLTKPYWITLLANSIDDTYTHASRKNLFAIQVLENGLILVYDCMWTKQILIKNENVLFSLENVCFSFQRWRFVNIS